jgi:hypothetical protein
MLIAAALRDLQWRRQHHPPGHQHLGPHARRANGHRQARSIRGRHGLPFPPRRHSRSAQRVGDRRRLNHVARSHAVSASQRTQPCQAVIGVLIAAICRAGHDRNGMEQRGVDNGAESAVVAGERQDIGIENLSNWSRAGPAPRPAHRPLAPPPPQRPARHLVSHERRSPSSFGDHHHAGCGTRTALPCQ